MRLPDRTLSIVLVGLQGAGKSTLARERLSETHLRLNLDMLRTRHREALLLDACLVSKTPFVIDNTNLTREERVRYVQAASGRAELGAIWLDAPLAKALARNAERADTRRVPDHVIVGAERRFVAPSCAEGFAIVWRVVDDAWSVIDERSVGT